MEKEKKEKCACWLVWPLKRRGGHRGDAEMKGCVMFCTWFLVLASEHNGLNWEWGGGDKRKHARNMNRESAKSAHPRHNGNKHHKKRIRTTISASRSPLIKMHRWLALHIYCARFANKLNLSVGQMRLIFFKLINKYLSASYAYGNTLDSIAGTRFFSFAHGRAPPKRSICGTVFCVYFDWKQFMERGILISLNLCHYIGCLLCVLLCCMCALVKLPPTPSNRSHSLCAK